VNVGTGPYAWIVYSYDALGRVDIKSECLPIDCGNNHHDMRRTYNLAGELTFYDRGLDADRNSADPNQGYYFGGYNLSYDGAGNVSQVTGDTAGTNTATNIFTNTDYFPNGQLYTAQVLGTYNDKFSVNTRGWYTGEILTNSGGTTMWQSTTTRNNVGNVTATTDTAAGHWTYTDDQLNRLSTAAGPQGTTSYTLDDFGNMSGKTVTAGSGWPLSGLQPAANNSLVGNSLQYDLGTLTNPAGHITYDGYHHYTYDAEGRLAQVDTTCYMYDGEGHRVAKTNCSTGIQAEYLYDTDGRLLSEVNVSTEQISRANIYAGGRFIAEDSPDSYYTSTTTATQMRVLDQVGSLRGLLDLGQHIVSSYTGGPLGDSYTCSSGEDMLFTGQKCDSESALDYFGARYYTSTLGRFTSPDSSGRPVALPYASLSNPQSLNLYSYVENNPAGSVDPDGHRINVWVGAPSCAGEGSIGCSPEQNEQPAAQQAAAEQQSAGSSSSNSSSSGSGLLSHLVNLLHGRSWNYSNATVTTSEQFEAVDTKDEGVTVLTDTAAFVSAATHTQSLGIASGLVSSKNDPSATNRITNFLGLFPGFEYPMADTAAFNDFFNWGVQNSTPGPQTDYYSDHLQQALPTQGCGGEAGGFGFPC
jgi:RHS repeat-associated protein